MSSTTNQSGTKQCCSAEFDNLLFAFGNVKYLLLQSNVFLLLLPLLLLLQRDKTKMPETISPGHKSLSVMNSPENRNQCAASTPQTPFRAPPHPFLPHLCPFSVASGALCRRNHNIARTHAQTCHNYDNF